MKENVLPENTINYNDSGNDMKIIITLQWTTCNNHT